MPRELLCPEHGMVDVDGDRCPLCGLTVLDPDDPASREAVAGAKQLHTLRGQKTWMLLLLVLGVFAAPFVALTVSTNENVIAFSQWIAIFAGSGAIAAYVYF